MLIGAIHLAADPSKISRVYSFAAAAKMEGVEFFYFLPEGIDFKNRRIEGRHYQNGKWKQKMFPFPDIVINMFRVNAGTEKQKKVYRKLRDEVIYTETRIGTKEKIHNLLEKHDYFKNFLPKTEIAGSIDNVVEFINIHNKVILKPMKGCNGKGILIIEKYSDKYKINDNQTESVVNSLYFLEDKELKKYLIQQFITSETKSGVPVVFRLHTQKNGEGKYILSIINPVIARVKNKVANFSQGDYAANVKYYMKNEFNEDRISIYKLMKEFAINVSEFINEHYDDNLNELGIDVGIDKEHNLYLYEVNWRPGPPKVFSGGISHAKNKIRYCAYKVEKSKSS